MHPAPVPLARISHVVLLLLILAALASAQENNVRPLIVQAVDDSQLTTLKGNTHPLARAQFDRGAAPPDLPMQRMLLVLKRSDEQESALRKLLDDQQDKASPNYHKWLTPEQFGRQFRPGGPPRSAPGTPISAAPTPRTPSAEQHSSNNSVHKLRNVTLLIRAL